MCPSNMKSSYVEPDRKKKTRTISFHQIVFRSTQKLAGSHRSLVYFLYIPSLFDIFISIRVFVCVESLHHCASRTGLSTCQSHACTLQLLRLQFILFIHSETFGNIANILFCLLLMLIHFGTMCADILSITVNICAPGILSKHLPIVKLNICCFICVR